MAFIVAFTVPARKRVKHVWTYWGAISGSVETGACSATPAGEIARPPQSGSGCQPEGCSAPGGGLNAEISSVFPGEIPGRSRLALLGRLGLPQGSA